MSESEKIILKIEDRIKKLRLKRELALQQRRRELVSNIDFAIDELKMILEDIQK